MPHQIRITVGQTEVDAVLNDTATARGVLEILPITATVKMWGEEIYFTIPMDMGEEDAREEVAVGDIAYWPQGKAMCIFFGRTPVSRGDEPRAISPVNVIGRVEASAEILARVKQGDTISIRR
jgi:hypothetical protein